MLKIFLLFGFAGICVGEVLLRITVPSTWSVDTNYPGLATVYGAPPPASIPGPAQFPDAPPPPSPENFEFSGQLVQINQPVHKSNNAQIQPRQFGQLKTSTPPSTAAFLPKENPPKPFRSPLNSGEVFVNPQHNQQTVFARTQQLPQFQEIKQFNPSAQQQQQRQQQQQQFQQQQQQQPAVHTEYGPPPNLYPYPPSPQQPSPFIPIPPPPSVHEVINETPLENDGENDTDDPNVIAVANASGQYYILGKDNTLQRVVYETSKSEEDNIKNGFTAHLRYTHVEPIRDPIYRYDDQGHLVRLYNKK